MTPFRDNVVVLTGASRGIGRELALQLASQGALLALSDRDAAGLEGEVADLLRDFMGKNGERGDEGSSNVAQHQEQHIAGDKRVALPGPLGFVFPAARVDPTTLPLMSTSRSV